MVDTLLGSRHLLSASLALFCVSVCGSQVEFPFPHVDITNGVLQATVALPNAERGYYRGSRFDWSGVISRLEYKGHNFFGVWFPHYDPELHDAITGPVEEFRTGDAMTGSALGFDAAPAGGMFVKIGVGVLRKPDSQPYLFARHYAIVNHGIWTSRPGSDRVEMEQDLRDDSGYAYHYTKSVKLVAHRPELVLEHALKNTGKLAIDTYVYDHDFYVLDGQPTGPATHVYFAFSPVPDTSHPVELAGKAQFHGNELRYTRELSRFEHASSVLKGFGETAKDNDFRVENQTAGIGVRETGDHPLVGLNLWSIRTTVCPEAFIHLHAEPGETVHWKIRYVFYQLPR